MPSFLCATCGTRFADAPRPPATCPVCEDERQYVGWQGQQWLTREDMLARYRQRIEIQHDALAIGITPAFAINQRSFLLRTDAGNIFWECQSIVTDSAIAAIKMRGGIDRIIISHPHFYAAMTDWSDAFGGAPILLHEADQAWVQSPSPAIRFWTGDTLALSPSVTLIRTGGHFVGSTALHWRDGPRPGGALFAGDTPQVCQDRRHVSFMYSNPNLIPMAPEDVKAMRERLGPFTFEDVFGYTWDRDIVGGGREAVNRSFERYLEAISMTRLQADQASAYLDFDS